MNNKTLLLDMDGVLADWFGGTCKLFNLTAEQVLAQCPERPHKMKLEDYLTRVLKKQVTHESMWARIDQQENFWLDLDPLPWLKELWELITRKHELNVVIASDPHAAPYNSGHKITWLRHYLPELGHRNWMFGAYKTFMASRRVILLDDSDTNHEEFVKRGGYSILFPQPWNKNFVLIDQRLAYVDDQLRELKGA